jgi:exodeoxyribonuclease VII large subunit
MTSAILTVTKFIELINFTLDSLDLITVEGEVNEFKVIQNKWVTFKLKDQKSTVDCFMTVWQLKTQIEDGMLVRATGHPKLRDKGFFSFVLERVQPSGEGALKRAFELLRKKLEAEGLFAPQRKRSLPRFPEHVALITSRDAAAYTDFLKVLKARQGGLTISFIHAQVQGVDAPRQLIEALTYANTELKNLDVIVMIRGGGSLEDLQAFNDESVIREVAASRAPTIIGIGHERDITLAELAADVRASTPSNAAELLVRSRQEVRLAIDHLQKRLIQHLADFIRERRTTLVQHQSHLRTRLTFALQQRRDSLRQIIRVLQSLSPKAVLARGYSITRTTKGKVVRGPEQVKVGEKLLTQVAKGVITSTVGSQQKNSQRQLNLI